MKRTTCPHCSAVNSHPDAPGMFTRASCTGCGRPYLRRPVKCVAAIYRRINGTTTRHELTGALTSAGFLPGAINF